jgi:hypothetical protein
MQSAVQLDRTLLSCDELDLQGDTGCIETVLRWLSSI